MRGPMKRAAPKRNRDVPFHRQVAEASRYNITTVLMLSYGRA